MSDPMLTAGVARVAALDTAALAPVSNARKMAVPTQASFADALQAAASRSVDAVRQSEAASLAAAGGDASLQDVVHSVMSAEMAVESVVAVRNRMIEAYQEIMRMPI